MRRREMLGGWRFVRWFVAPLAAGAFVAIGGTTLLRGADPQIVPAAHASDIRWQTDLPAAHKKAVAEGKPLLIVFSAEWCGYCKKMERSTLVDAKVSALVQERFVAVHLDMDKHPRVAEALEVRALPSSVILSPEADLLGRSVGFVEAEPYRKVLDRGLRLLEESRADADD